LENAIEANMDLGRGQGPLNHMANIVDFQKNIKTEETNNETL